MKINLEPVIVAAVSVIWFNLLFSGQLIRPWAFWELFPAGLAGIFILIITLEKRFPDWPVMDFRKVFRDIVLGAVSAVLLYGIFFLGRWLLSLIFWATPEHIAAVYSLREGESLWRVGLLLALFIGPGEEILWRGYLQKSFAERLGGWKSLFLVSLLYAGAHAASANPVLIMAALVCGLWWGAQYFLFRSIPSNMVSHALWDLLVFIWFPF